jgi:hypothetical protein
VVKNTITVLIINVIINAYNHFLCSGLTLVLKIHKAVTKYTGRPITKIKAVNDSIA